MHTYSKQWGIFRNPQVTAEIKSLNPVTDHARIVHLLTGYEFPWDVVRALEVALMRTFCSGSVSSLLHRTGEFRKHGQKRYDDTALLVAEFMQNGYDSDRGKRAIEHINKIHGFYQIANDDFLFVLSTFVLLPAQWIDAFGWRKITENERQALFYFFVEVGKRMNIQNLPATLEDLEFFVQEYERKNFVFEPSNQQVGNATVHIIEGWMPFFLRPLVLPVVKCLLDEKMLRALGYSTPPGWLKKMVMAAMKARAILLRKISFKKYPSFVTTEPNRTYPKGYYLENLGPANLVSKLKSS